MYRGAIGCLIVTLSDKCYCANMFWINEWKSVGLCDCLNACNCRTIWKYGCWVWNCYIENKRLCNIEVTLYFYFVTVTVTSSFKKVTYPTLTAAADPAMQGDGLSEVSLCSDNFLTSMKFQCLSTLLVTVHNKKNYLVLVTLAASHQVQLIQKGCHREVT